MITHIALFSFGLRDSTVTKSIVICSHFHSDIGNGWSSPADSDVLLSPTGIPDTLPHTGRSLFSLHSARSVVSNPHTS